MGLDQARQYRELQLAGPHISDFDRFIFIIGAPRSGTTTMSRMLQAHPQIAFPFVKDVDGLSTSSIDERLQQAVA